MNKLAKCSHLFPSINATVRSLYSLPALPFTVGFSVFSLYMNSNASKMTFCVTCVVDKIVTTHFRNETVGIASGTRRLTGDEALVHSLARRRVAVDSNQNKQVIYYICQLKIYDRTEFIPEQRTPPDFPRYCLSMLEFEGLAGSHFSWAEYPPSR